MPTAPNSIRIEADELGQPLMRVPEVGDTYIFVWEDGDATKYDGFCIMQKANTTNSMAIAKKIPCFIVVSPKKRATQPSP